MSVIRLVGGTCAGLEWTGAQNQVEYPLAACLAWAMDQWISTAVARSRRRGFTPVISTGTFGVAPQDAGVASATVTVGQQLGASVGTSLLNTIFTAAITSYLTAHLAAARLIGRQALTGLALAHGYDTAFWWIAGIFAVGAVVGGVLLRPGPLVRNDTPSPAPGGVTTAQAQANPARPA